MPKPPRVLPAPTAAELRILRVLWARGPSTVREIHDATPDPLGLAYTTTLKILQIMHEKGLVRREELGRTHRYSANVAESEAQRRATTDLITRLFQGSAFALVLNALEGKPATADEIRKIRDLLDDQERRGGKP